MRHGVKNKKLGVNAKHKRAILRSLATSIVLQGLKEDQRDRAVRTTLLKARLVRSVVDRLVTYAKKGDLSARREAARILRGKEAVKGLFDVIGPRYKDRNGGYTRVLKLGPNRPGDAAEMALVSLVEDEIPAKEAPKAEEAAPAAEAKPIDMVKGAAQEAEAEK